MLFLVPLWCLFGVFLVNADNRRGAWTSQCTPVEVLV